MRSVSQRLLISVTLLLLLFFGVMVAVLDARFRAIAEHSLRDLLDAQMVALIASAEPDASGHIVPRLSDAESRLATPGSGLYAAVSAAGRWRRIWRSPSATGSLRAVRSAAGARRARLPLPARMRAAQSLAAVSRGVQWEDETGGAAT